MPKCHPACTNVSAHLHLRITCITMMSGRPHIGIMHVILAEVFWVFAVPAVARVRRSSPGSRPSPAGDLRSALTPAAVRRVDEVAGAGKMGGVVGCMVQSCLPVAVPGR
jgi:hypothetical protein